MPASLFPVTAKLCRRCGQTKPVDQFYGNARRRDGLYVRCKACQTELRRKSYLRTNGVEGVRRQNWARYGLSPDDYHRMLREQDGRCKVCRAEPSASRLLDVDHCHATGKVRGLLCPGCNRAIGGARDQPDVLRALAAYVEEHATAVPTGGQQDPHPPDPQDQQPTTRKDPHQP